MEFMKFFHFFFVCFFSFSINFEIENFVPFFDILHYFPGFTCDQFINSETSLNGSFHSPNYPDLYPEGVRCRYYFNGHGKQRVQIVFNEFDLVKSSLKPKPMR